MNNKNFIDFVKEKYKTLVIPFIMLVLGIFIALKPGSVFGFAITLVGILMMIAGVVIGCSLLAAFSGLTTVAAIVLFLFGLICVINPGGTASLVIKIVGVVILVNSIMKIIEAYKLKGKSDGFMAYIINDAVTAVLGLVLLLVGTGATNIVFVIIGIVMAILGISNIVTEYKVYKDGCFVNDGSDVVWEEEVK